MTAETGVGIAAGGVAEPFAGLTGRGVRIAIIDSGVHPDHPHIDAARLAGGVTVAKDGTVAPPEEDEGGVPLDRLGHGTAVTAAIQEKAPDAHCLSVRVFHDSLKTTAAALIVAIDWCVDQRVDLINLSLGSTNSAHRDGFARAVERARAAGALLIAAREANDIACYPGALPQVVGVGLDWECPRECYRVEAVGESTVFVASGYPRPIPGVPLRRNLYGISFAAAQMTGFAARACEHLGTQSAGAGRCDALRALLAGEGLAGARASGD